MSEPTRLIIVTGASRGFGEAIATEIVTNSPKLLLNSKILLLARNTSKLNQLQTKLDNKVSCCTIDLTDLNQVELFFKTTISSDSQIEEIIVFHNSGSLGKLNYIEKLDKNDIEGALKLNVTSTFYMTSLIMKLKLKTTIVNISSLAALKPFECWSLYCSGKAAREMFFKTLAVEYDGLVRVLNYAPGPLDTDMQMEIRELMPDNVELKNTFVTMKKEGKLISPSESAQALIRILEVDQFENGAHIDYYDVMENKS